MGETLFLIGATNNNTGVFFALLYSGACVAFLLIYAGFRVLLSALWKLMTPKETVDNRATVKSLKGTRRFNKKTENVE